MSGYWRTAAVLAAFVVAGATAPSPEAPPLSPEPANELLIAPPVDEAAPAAVPALEAIEVREDGAVVPVAAISPETRLWRVVVYFDQLLAGPVDFRNAALELSEQAKALVALGPVEIVLAGEETRTALPATRDPLALAEGFSWMRIRESPDDGQRAIRERFLRETGLASGESPESSELAERIASTGASLRLALEDEAALLARHRERLLTWLMESHTPGPKLLLMVTSGIDTVPSAFYREVLEGGALEAALSGVSDPPVEPALAETAQALALYGWVTVPFAPSATSDAMLAETEEQVRRRKEAETVKTVVHDGQLIDRVETSIDPRKLFRRRGEKDEGAPPTADLVAPLGALERLAAETGGRVVRDKPQLTAELARLPRKYRVSFDSARGGGPIWPVEVRLAGSAIAARRWTGAVQPEALSRVRARGYLYSPGDEGEIPVSAALTAGEAGEGRLIVRFDPAALGEVEPNTLRITVAVADPSGDSTITSHQLSELAARDFQPDPELPSLLRASLGVTGVGDAPVVAIVEETTTGRWGGASATLAAGSEGVGVAGDSFFLPAPKAIHLLAPRAAIVMGQTTIETVVSEHRVSSVEFYLDGERVSVAHSPPFSTTLDLGKLPEIHRVEAVARDAEGRELDRDRLTVNEGSGSFRVRIRDPRTSAQREGRELLVGSVPIEADVKVPRGTRLRKLEFHWQDELVATRFAAPFVQRVTIAKGDPQGFLRVVGELDDGQSAEDVLFLNSPGASERLEVELVELYVVVTDRQGKPLRGLAKEQFELAEEGREQELATFSDAGDLPLTVGLTIDSSASMFIKLPEVQDAAARYVRGLQKARDRAFVVGFGSEPRLARDTTADLSRVVDGLYRLQPDGQTAIWRAVVYSLVQLQGVTGKKALIVYSDGADDDPDFSYRTCLRFARRVGVPIYFIVANDEIYRTRGKSLNVRSFLGRLEGLSREVGGRVFVTRVSDDLGAIYREIDEELRSQYVLGYYAESGDGDKWRDIDVKVRAPGASARTIAGFYQ